MVAFDAASNAHSGTGSSTGDFSWTHTPVGTPKGVLVLIVLNAEAIDEISGVTYGGVAMAEVTDSPLLHSTGSEDGTLFGYFLGSGIPTGAQTVAVTVSGSTRAKTAEAISVTASGDTQVDDTGTFESGAASNPSVALATTADAELYAALHSGAASSGVDVDGNTTLIREATFTGTFTYAYGRRSTSGAGSFGIGWTIGSDEQAILAVAIKEGAPALSGSATATAKPQATAVGTKDVSGSASGSAKTTVTADGSAIAESGSASCSAKPTVTGSGSPGPPTATARVAMII